GYHGSSMRTLARGLRMEPASLYYHFPSKQDILFAILDRTLDDLLDGLRAAVTAAGDDRARLQAAVRFHVLFHVRRRQEAFLSHSDLRPPTPAHLRRVPAKRDVHDPSLRRPGRHRHRPPRSPREEQRDLDGDASRLPGAGRRALRR